MFDVVELLRPGQEEEEEKKDPDRAGDEEQLQQARCNYRFLQGRRRKSTQNPDLIFQEEILYTCRRGRWSSTT